MRAIEHWVASTHSWVPGRGPHPVVPVGRSERSHLPDHPGEDLLTWRGEFPRPGQMNCP